MSIETGGGSVISKEEALQACKKCPDNMVKQGCVYADIVGGGKYIPNPPECILSLISKAMHNVQHGECHTGSPSADIGVPRGSQSTDSNQPNGTSPHVANGTPIQGALTNIPSWWTEDDTTILKVVGSPSNGYSQNQIIKESGIASTTVRRRLKKLVQEKFLIRCEKSTGTVSGQTQLVYSQTTRCAKLNVYHVEGAADNENLDEGDAMITSRHASSWKAEILFRPKYVPVQAQTYKEGMKGWTGTKKGLVFENEDEQGRFVIKTDPKNAIIDFKRSYLESFPPMDDEILSHKLHDLEPIR